ncbi:hypothetical protein [Chitinophaga sp. RAB17]|uniref:hypothetical protein n=1 Tax=Chitinophaga sp. RAB17 TaxID=3233049 RepID=UPI003F936551
MGAFNTLDAKMLPCPNCHHVQDWKLQFKYSDCWQFSYRMYDTLRWGGNDVGDKNASIVLVEGVPENQCSQCLEHDFYARIFVDDNKLVAASLVLKPLLFFDNEDGDYLIIK